LAAETQSLESTNTTSKGFALTSAFWMMIATFYGLLGATELVAPDLTENIGGIVFGRVRPTHMEHRPGGDRSQSGRRFYPGP